METRRGGPDRSLPCLPPPGLRPSTSEPSTSRALPAFDEEPERPSASCRGTASQDRSAARRSQRMDGFLVYHTRAARVPETCVSLRCITPEPTFIGHAGTLPVWRESAVCWTSVRVHDAGALGFEGEEEVVSDGQHLQAGRGQQGRAWSF